MGSSASSDVDVTVGMEGAHVRAVVVGASTGLGRCIGIGLVKRGAQVALLARSRDKLDTAVEEAGAGAFAVTCDVTDPDGCRAALDEAAERLGGIDALVYTPAVGPLARVEDTDPATWARVFETNVTGASVVTAAALPHLDASSGRAAYLSSVSASQTKPWPGLAAYAVSKAAMEKLVEAWQVEHPHIGFTSVIVGDCTGGEGDGMTHFANDWDPELAGELGVHWIEHHLIAGCFIDVDELCSSVDSLLRSGPSLSIPTIVVAPRPQKA
jgi:NAD(P)-dependent dehydrogenase (short-subunit alcohol dehydrogenase family)